MDNQHSHCKYDVCLSFAGEDRVYVEQTAKKLRDLGVHVFYDHDEKVELWGKNLYEHFADIYQNSSRFCVIFVSKHYEEKLWTKHERRHAQTRAFENNGEYLLPVRIDDTELPGLPKTIGHIDLREVSTLELAEMIEKKVMPQGREHYFPNNLVNLYESLDIEDDEKSDVTSAAYRFFSALQRMKTEELEVIYHLFLHGCPAELPDNIHISQDLLSRVTGFKVRKLKRILGSISSLGFTVMERDDTEHDNLGESKFFVLEWYDLGIEGIGNSTWIANEVILLAASAYCEEHAMESLMRLDFSALDAKELKPEGV